MKDSFMLVVVFTKIRRESVTKCIGYGGFHVGMWSQKTTLKIVTCLNNYLAI